MLSACTPLILAATVIPERVNNSRRASVSDASQTDRYVPLLSKSIPGLTSIDVTFQARAYREDSVLCSS
jgi:hypothetical protein